MDEADILGDRIAIMAEGKLRCVGSSLFLKKTYGVGYQLTIEKDQQFQQERGTIKESKRVAVVDASNGLVNNDSRLNDIVTGAVDKASLLSNVGSEMNFQLPMDAASQFTPMFEGLDKEIEKGTIHSYGVSITTLDEVFLLVARGDTIEEKKHFAPSTEEQQVETGSDDLENSYRSNMDLEKEVLFRRHLGALFRKRATNFRRDRKAWVCTTIVPGIFVLVGFLLFRFASPARNLPALTLSFEDYNSGLPEPRNLVTFNNPGNSYTCQPGTCAYSQEDPVMSSPATNERYFFCGSQARLSQPADKCSINESEKITERITEGEAQAMGTTASNILSVRMRNTS